MSKYPDVTKALAKQILANAPKTLRQQTKVKRERVKLYTRLMRDGEWVVPTVNLTKP